VQSKEKEGRQIMNSIAGKEVPQAVLDNKKNRYTDGL